MRTVKTELADAGVMVIRLDRPKANAFDLELMAALRAVITDAGAREEVRALVITGEGRFFSAGLDFGALTATLADGAEATLAFGGNVRETFLALWQCPKPTVAAVNGHAIAAGLFFALCCDLRFVIEGDSEFGVNELLFGAGFPPIAIELGRWAMGRDFAQVILGAQLYDWRAGLDNGTFHDHAATRGELLAKAMRRAAALGAMPAAGYAHAKAQLIAPHILRVVSESAEHAAKTSAIFTSPESRASIEAYLAHGRK